METAARAEILCKTMPKILPAFKENNIAVVFESSELFVPYLSVALASLIACTSAENNYDIIILSSEIKESDEAALCDLCDGKDNVSVRFFNPTSIVEKYIQTAKHSYLAINYYRMSLPWILTEYPKAINLGADLIVEHDISELFCEPMREDCYLAGAPDLGYHGRLSLDISPDELGLSDPYSYINADVLLFDLEKIRRDYCQDELMDIWQKYCFRCAEQDALNVFFDRHIHHLDLRWNIFPDRMTSEYHVLHAPEDSVKVWRKSLCAPYLIHYAAVPKPWDFPMVGWGERWWFYARQSIYYEEIIRRMCITACRDSDPDTGKSWIRRLADKVLPLGSRRRSFAKILLPRGSGRWNFCKRIQCLFFGSKDPNAGKKYGRNV